MVVKLVSADDGSDVQRNKMCGFLEEVVYEGTNYRNYTTTGAFYSGSSGCCDMCTRDPLCTHFTAMTGKLGRTQLPKCVFYSNVTDVVKGPKNKWRKGLEDLDLLVVSGVKRTERAANMFACGWDYAAEDSPCLDGGRDDVVYMEDETVTFEGGGKGNSGAGDMKVCDAGSQRISEGRWVQAPRSELGCGDMTAREPTSKFFQTVHFAAEAEEVRV